MNTLLSLESVFTYSDAPAPLPVDTEAEMIAAAQQGDEAAQLELLAQYAPALRAAVSRFKGGVADGQLARSSEYGTPSRSIDDLQGVALVAFFEVIAEHDPELNPRLAGRLTARLNNRLADEATASAAFAVPERTLSRFYGILRKADGDDATARQLAPEHGMSHETFDLVRSVVRETSSLSRDDDEGPEVSGALVGGEHVAPLLEVEDAILVDLAFAAVDDDEARVCELAYGFTTFRPYSDGEVAEATGLSRQKAQRTRTRALSKMRDAIGALEEGDWK